MTFIPIQFTHIKKKVLFYKHLLFNRNIIYYRSYYCSYYCYDHSYYIDCYYLHYYSCYCCYFCIDCCCCYYIGCCYCYCCSYYFVPFDRSPLLIVYFLLKKQSLHPIYYKQRHYFYSFFTYLFGYFSNYFLIMLQTIWILHHALLQITQYLLQL